MADDTRLNVGTGGDLIATDELTTLNGGAVSAIKVQRVKVGFGADAALRDVDASNGLPVVGPLTDAQLRAAVVPVSLTSTTVTGSVAVTGPLTDTQLRATAVPVSLTSTTITGTVAATKSGAFPLDTAAKGTTVAGNVTSEATDANTQSLHARLTNASLAVTGPLTDAQLRATAVPISLATAPVTAVTDNAGSLTVDAPVGTPAFVRLSDGTTAIATLPVSLAVAPTTPVTGTFFQATQPVSLATAPVTAVTDNAGSLTVDAPVATPVFVRLSDGAAAVAPLVSADLTSGATKEQLFDVQTNQTALVTSLRHQIAGGITRIFGDSFADGIGSGEEDAGAFPATATVTGSATGTAASGQLTMTTGATTGSTGSFQSTNVLPFVTGSVANSQNGMTFPSANLTAFRVVSRRASVDTVVESSAFNVVPTAITNSGLSNAAAGTLVNGVLHRCDIFYQGNAAIFAIDGVAVHRMSAQIAAPRTDTLDFPTFFEWSNTATPTATLRAGQYNATNGYFFECQYNVANVTMTCRGASANRLGPAPRVTKILQGFDSARSRVVIKFEAVAPATGDTLLSLVKQTAGVDAGGATSIGVASNKVLRITGGQLSVKANAAAQAFGTLTLRQNPSGATVIGSPSWGRFDTEITTAVAGDAKWVFFNFSEAQEFSGAQTLGASLSAQAITNIISISLYGYEYNIGN